jgi:DNA topoisomerase-3
MPKLAALSDTEQKIYTLIIRRFLAVFFPAAVYEVTTRITRVENYAFKTEGKVLKEAGWLAVYGKDANGVEEDILAPISENEKVRTEEMEVREQITKPPARYTEATLLSAMEGAGKLVEDEELRHAMAAKGLGTPATRAAIIENLIHENYIVREGRDLIPTAKAFNLLETLQVMNIPTLSSPELTGEWEYKLRLIEKQELTRSEFMSEIQKVTRSFIGKIKDFDPDEAGTYETNLIDPFSGEKMLETLHDYRSPDGKLVIRKAIASRVMDIEEIRELLEKRVVGPLGGFRSKQGRPFNAYVRLNEDKSTALDWGNNGSSNGSNGEAMDPSKLETIGVCPKDKAKILMAPNAYVCENTIGENPKCDFRISVKILGKDILREQVEKLLKEGKTDLITGFFSQKSKKPFKAHLILKEDGSIGFEFPPKTKKKKASSKTKKSSDGA